MRTSHTFTREFKREAACLVLDQGYSVRDVCTQLDLEEGALMREAGLRSGQPGPRPYKKHGQARVDIPNLLDRQFDGPAPNRVWCGDISYVWAGDRWH